MVIKRANTQRVPMPYHPPLIVGVSLRALLFSVKFLSGGNRVPINTALIPSDWVEAEFSLNVCGVTAG